MKKYTTVHIAKVQQSFVGELEEEKLNIGVKHATNGFNSIEENKLQTSHFWHIYVEHRFVL